MLLEVGYLGYTTLQEEPDLDTAEIKASMEIREILMAERKSQIEQKEALKYLEETLQNATDCTTERKETATYEIGAGIFDVSPR